MKRIKNNVRLCIYLILLPLGLSAQTLAGYNFTGRYVERFAGNAIGIDYNQVWSIEEGPHGFIFAATNEGLAMFDGVRWRLYACPNESIIRALHYDKISGKLYSAGVNSFGYWILDSMGDMKYTTLFSNSESGKRSLDFWKICVCDEGKTFYFQTHGALYKYAVDSTQVRQVVLPKGTIGYSFSMDNHIYIQIDDRLLLLERDDTLSEVLRLQSRVVAMFRSGSDVMVAVEHQGLFRLTGGVLKPVNETLNAKLSVAKINCCLPYADGYLAGSTKSGLIVIDPRGNVVANPLENSENLSHTVLSLAVDGNSDIWIGFNSGIAKIDISSNEQYIFNRQFGLVEDLLSKGGLTLVATNRGLFEVSAGGGNINMVGGSPGATWKVVEIGKTIYVLHDRGLFEYNNGALRLVNAGGIINLVQMRQRKDFYIACNYDGLSLYRLVDEKLVFVRRIAGFDTYPYRLTIDRFDNLWFVVSGVGFQRIKLTPDCLKVAQSRDFNISFDERSSKKALCITRINGDFILCANNTAYSYHPDKDEIFVNDSITALLSECGTDLMCVEQRENKLWYLSQDDIGYLELVSGEAIKHAGIFGQSRRGRITPQFFTLNDYVAVGFDNSIGFIKGNTAPVKGVEIGKAEAFGAKGSKFFDKSQKVFEIPFSMNNLRIYPVSIPAGTMVDYRVSGISERWNTMKLVDVITVHALPSGSHTVEIRPSGISDPQKYATLKVRVARPWYISSTAIVLYTLFFLTAMLLLRTYYRRSNRKQQRKLRAHQEETLEREKLKRDKQIAELQKDQIQIELREKDKRLATITMNSIKRNNMLNELKSEVLEIQGSESPSSIKQQVQRVIRKINTQLSNEDDWEKSESYFNTIYDGLLDRLKKQYPLLTKTDLKLCVYMKLNYSTKEIAELMNISPRSVEMGRYRLRKKLGISQSEPIDTIFK